MSTLSKIVKIVKLFKDCKFLSKLSEVLKIVKMPPVEMLWTAEKSKIRRCKWISSICFFKAVRWLESGNCGPSHPLPDLKPAECDPKSKVPFVTIFWFFCFWLEEHWCIEALIHCCHNIVLEGHWCLNNCFKWSLLAKL